MATSIRFTVSQRGAAGVDFSFAVDAIVDDPQDAYEQGREVYALMAAFENGVKVQAADSE